MVPPRKQPQGTIVNGGKGHEVAYRNKASVIVAVATSLLVRLMLGLV